MFKQVFREGAVHDGLPQLTPSEVNGGKVKLYSNFEIGDTSNFHCQLKKYVVSFIKHVKTNVLMDKAEESIFLRGFT